MSYELWVMSYKRNILQHHAPFRIIFLLFFIVQFSFFTSKAQDAPDTSYVYRSISAASADPDAVFKLNLSNRKLRQFPPEIFNFKNLRELDISHNKIDSIPERISELQNLQRLVASNNKLTSLPNSIGDLTALTFLGLNRNKIEELPVSIGKLQNLEVLELWDNELYKIPDEISNLKNLKMLELRGILFSEEEAARIDSLLPDTKVMISPPCNCKF